MGGEFFDDRLTDGLRRSRDDADEAILRDVSGLHWPPSPSACIFTYELPVMSVG